MVVDLTLLAGSTEVERAGVHALVVLAGVQGRTFAVTSAPHLFDAPIVRVNGETRRTEFTGGLVILNHAGSISGAFLSIAGVLALVSNAGLTRGTSTILQADGDGRIAVVFADADGLVLQHLAFLVGWTHSDLRARVDACSLPAGLVGWAVSFDSALYLTVRTSEFSELVDDETVFAHTLRLVPENRAPLVEGAGLYGAGINALTGLGVTGCSRGTS